MIKEDKKGRKLNMNNKWMRKTISFLLTFLLIFTNFSLNAFAVMPPPWGYYYKTIDVVLEELLVEHYESEIEEVDLDDEVLLYDYLDEKETELVTTELAQDELDDDDDEEREALGRGIVVASRHFDVEPATFDSGTFSNSDGVYSHRNWAPDVSYDDLLEARASSRRRDAVARHHFDATRSLGAPGIATFGEMSIESVSIMYGGEYQARFRDQVSHGHSLYYGNESSNWYTTSRSATLMDGRVFTIHTEVDLSDLEVADYQDFLDSITYTYGDLPFEDWLGGPQFNNVDQRFIHLVSDELISTDYEGIYLLETMIEFRSPYAAANPANVNIPFTGYRGTNQQGFSNAMRHVIGTFDLSVYSEMDETAAVQLGQLPINLNLYDDFHLWEEIDAWARDLRTEAGSNRTINNRHVDVTSLGHSHEGRDLWNIVIAESGTAVNDYFRYTRPRMTGSLQDLEALTAEIENGTRHHRIPIYFHNNHPDEVTGVDAQLAMVEQLLHEEYLTFETVTEDQTFGIMNNPLWGTPTPHPNGYVSIQRDTLTSREDTTTVTINVEEALNYFIFIFVPTNNPDGHAGMFRSNAYGFDLNRDASYQTQIENVLIVRDVLKWNPLALLEFHGHVAHMLIEPTTGPHNPNYEYDLLNPPMLRAAHIMGRAAISGAYDRYLIPAEHMTHGWDDGGPMYLPVFLMHFGILGFTLEIPHTNQDSFDANVAMGWAFVDHALDYFDELFLNRLEHNRRGMTNADYADLVDPFFTNPFTSPPTQIGRPRQEGLSFFPDYWVIPMDDFNQWNTLEAYNMLEKLERHYVQIERTTSEVIHDGTVFPAGTYVIDMRQAHRGYVNTMLEAGYDASFFASMYAEITMNFPHLRGFEATAIWEPDLFDGQTAPVQNLSVPPTLLASGTSPYLTIRNNNQDAIRLVNELLRHNVDVHMLTSYAQEGVIGDFVVERQALTPTRLAGRFVETTALEAIPETAQQLEQPRIALLTGARPAMQGMFSPAPFVMRDLGFEYTWVTSDAMLGGLTPGYHFNIIVNHHQTFANASTISNAYDIPIIAVQTNAAVNAVNNLFSERGVVSNTITASREGTFLASYSRSSMMSAHYGNLNAAYLIGATTFYSIPTGTTPLVTIADGDFADIFLGGWWQGEANQANVARRVTAFTGMSNADVPVTVFGSNIFNRAHNQAYFNMFATAAFMHATEIIDEARPFVTNSNSEVDEDLMLIELNFVANEVAGSEATITAQMFMISGEHSAAVFNPETAYEDGWRSFTDSISIDPTTEVVHWFAENSYGITAQGNLIYGLLAFEEEPIRHTITFDPMGGVVMPQTMETEADGTLANLPVPTRADHQFRGWFTARTDGTEVTTSTVFEGDATVFARWITLDEEVPPVPIRHTITFDPVGGVVMPQTMETEADGTLANLPVPTRADHQFRGWFTARTDGTEVTIATVFEGDTTIFARWTPGLATAPADNGQVTHPTLPIAGATTTNLALVGSVLVVAGAITRFKKVKK